MLNEPLLLFCWLWRQDPPMHGYDGSKVNLWAEQMDRHIAISHQLACVTDYPEGIDPSIRIIPMQHDFDDVRVGAWPERQKCPQCYRRLTIWAPDAEKRFGAKRFVSMDMDMLAFSNLDSLFDHDHDVMILKGTATHRPYNGGMVQMNAGARPQVFTKFTADGAALSRTKFVGSDQAWISHVLGRGEKTWGTQQGVYYKRLMPADMWKPPHNMRLLFFPGSPKPWDIQHSVPFIKATYEGKAIKTAAPALYAYDDPKHWGKWFFAYAKKRGVKCQLFKNNLPNSASVFVRLDQQGPQRAICLSITKRLASQGCSTLPTAREALWYDDKIAQYPALKPWMPETRILRSEQEAITGVGKMEFPIISKASEGAGSANVRVLQTKDDALAELRQAFGNGITLGKYGRRQQGYVYWQRIVPGNACDYRICIVGGYLYGLIRKNRAGTLLASGSGIVQVMQFKTERERQAADLAVQISKAVGTQWMAFDIVFEGDQPLVLEMSSAWTMESYKDCRLYTHDLQQSPLKGLDSFGVAVDVLLAMGGQRAAA
jgi:glutathione synthase/RimK-type ligase-like ATP-grasp enzyme